jgi:hypothetical protein
MLLDTPLLTTYLTSHLVPIKENTNPSLISVENPESDPSEDMPDPSHETNDLNSHEGLLFFQGRKTNVTNFKHAELNCNWKPTFTSYWFSSLLVEGYLGA